jgi:hypothetical protein
MRLGRRINGESRNAKAFDETVKKRNYNKLIASEIKPNDNTIPGIGSSRNWYVG